MSFLYPLFLLAGLLIAIPILIHLFNLRRYKTVLFPHTAFLKNIHLRSQKQSQVRYKWLLAARIAFLLSLILAFTQPFFKDKNVQTSETSLQVIYLDNSASMSVKNGARVLLDIAKENVKTQLRQAPQGSKFLILTNDPPQSYLPMPVEKALQVVNNTDISSVSKTASQIFNTVQGLMQSEAHPYAQLFYYSDFQKNQFPAIPDVNGLKNIKLFAMPLKANTPANVYIDTAILTSPVLQTGKNNLLIVTTKHTGKAPTEMPVLQLIINGQIKSASSLNFNEQKESIDTLSFQANEAGWQQMSLVVNDAVRFDDTFRIAARSNSNLSVLVLNEHQPNPFIQAAFKAYDGFRLDNRQVNETVDLKQYNLIILNGITQFTEALTKQVTDALQQGQSVAVFPNKTNNINALNSGLSRIASLQITGIDTASQTATTLQQGNELVKDIFERIPDNVQLPQANWHYTLQAALSANQQAVISFRNGDPLLAQFTPAKGKLYVLTTAADLQSGNFPGSYFFAPFFYQMTAQSNTGNVFAATAGTEQPIYISFKNTGERNMVHLTGRGKDIIPPQRPNGAGLDVFAGKAQLQAGFYTLTAPGNDSVQIAMNENRSESALEFWDIPELKNQWKDANIIWAETNETVQIRNGIAANFPLWKVCVILAVIMLAAETYLLASGYHKTSNATNVHSHTTG